MHLLGHECNGREGTGTLSGASYLVFNWETGTQFLGNSSPLHEQEQGNAIVYVLTGSRFNAYCHYFSHPSNMFYTQKSHIFSFKLTTLCEQE